MEEPLNIKSDWNERARADARWHIATAVSGDDEAEFDRSGRRDVEIFFEGHEELLHEGATVVDIGCGIGRMDQFVARQVGRLIGVDVSGEMVAQAAKRLAYLDNVEWREGDGYALPVEDASVDVVFSHIVFQHNPRHVTASYLRDVMRVLKQGGSLMFQIPEADDHTPPDPPGNDTFEMRYWKLEDLQALAAECGFVWNEHRRYRVGTEEFSFFSMRVRLDKPNNA